MKWIDCKKQIPKKHGFYKTLSICCDNSEDFKLGKTYLKEAELEFTGDVGEVLYWREIDDWIDFEDQIPPLMENVIACDCISGFSSIGYQEDLEVFCFMYTKEMQEDVVATHWKPMPKPKKY